jgi:hypothetical protein
MSVFFSEFFATLAATGVLLLLLLSAGAFFARLFRFPGFESAGGPERCGIALLSALAILPILFDFAGRVSPKAIPVLAALCVAAGLRDATRLGAPWPRRGGALWIGAGALWIVVAIALVVDWPDAAGGLHHSVAALDYVKHSETTWAIAQSGTPPINPTFLTPERASYYYFFYTLTGAVAALTELFGAEPRHAAYAAAPVAGFVIFALAALLWSRARFDEAVGARRGALPAAPLIGALLLTSGPDILFIVVYRLTQGEWLAGPETWAEQVTNWLDSALWAPHHVAAVAVAFMGLLALARPAAPDVRRVIFAGLAFSSLAGLSVYVAFGGAVVAAFWLCALALARRYADALRLAAAGALSALLAAPWIFTILGRASEGQAPVVFAIRNADFAGGSTGAPALDMALQLGALPFVYFANFGVFAFGAAAFWRRAGRKGAAGDVALLLALSAAASFLIGSFLRSAIVNNDLGWRVMLFAQFATLLWTVAAVRGGALDLRRPMIAGLCALGYASVLYGAAQLRLWPSPPLARVEPLATADEKRAWEWVNAALPDGAVAQGRPTEAFALGYGLYARRRSAVSDQQVGALFGASRREALARIEELAPIFLDPHIGIEAVEQLAARYQISAVVVTSLDAVFDAPGAWTRQRAPAFSAPRARVYRMQTPAQ